MEARTFNDDRGQVGIGTLIVFIAMVLVAAIAAGVLINTAGFLQSQSEQTGDESTAQVTDRLQVLSVTGDVVDREIETINVTVSQAPGSDDIDLVGATAQFVGPEGTFDIENEASEVLTSDNTFTHTAIRDVDGSEDIITRQDDRFRLSFSLNNGVEHGHLEEGDRAELTITTQAGGTATLLISVPDSLAGQSAVSL